MTRSAPKTTSAGSSRFPSAPLPPRAGAGLKTGHIDAILADDYRIGFLEVHAENYMGDGGPVRIAPFRPSAPSFRFRPWRWPFHRLQAELIRTISNGSPMC
jgi:hypothetical protein